MKEGLYGGWCRWCCVWLLRGGGRLLFSLGGAFACPPVMCWGGRRGTGHPYVHAVSSNTVFGSACRVTVLVAGCG